LSACRYGGVVTSFRTSGGRPRRAQVATAAEVTPNSDATSLRVIRSSPAAGPEKVAAARTQSGRTGGGTITFIASPAGQIELKSGAALVTAYGCSRAGPRVRYSPTPMPIALKVLLQLAVRDIGQLTDIQSRRALAGRPAPG